MDEDDDEKSNLIEFPLPSHPLPGSKEPQPHTFETLLNRQLQTIADTIGVPVTAFFDAAGKPESVDPAAQANGKDEADNETELAELVYLFTQIRNRETRSRCLALMRLFAAYEQR